MRIHRFFSSQMIETEDFVTVSDTNLIHQLRNVFRYKEGDQVVIFDGSGFDYLAKISSIDKNEVILEIQEKQEGVLPKQAITLFQSIVKKDNMEWIVEKATELGVSRIVPIISERSEKKDINIDRMKKIVIEASEQCGRSDIPEISEVKNFEECIKEWGSEAMLYHTESEESAAYTPSHHTSIFIGPEGGWTPAEISLAKENGAFIGSLGSLILRAETAAIVAISKFI